MGEFVRKTAIGFREVHGGQSNSDCTHVILTKKEYEEKNERIAKAEREAKEAKLNAKRKIQEERRRSEERLQVVEAALVQREIEMKRSLEAEKKECEIQRGLNVNLLRIAKERANADRRLKPKKEHTGYVVVTSMEKEYRYKDDDGCWEHMTLWETVLETPYIVRFEVPEVKRLMQELFQCDESGNCIIKRIGITANYESGYADMVKDREWKDHDQYNVMLERRLKANYRTGYWEIIFLHTKPLVSVPVDMMARVR